MNFMKCSKAILFDLDGVILDTESIYLKLMLEYNKKLNIPITKKFYIDNLLGKTKKEMDVVLKRRFKNKFNSEIYWDGILKFREEYISNNKVRVKRGFIELKKYLIKNMYNIGIVTSNSKNMTMQLLENAGLKIADFDVIITRDDVLNTKPSPDLYIKAIEHLKIDKKESIAIEDSNVGIQSAINAGITVVHFADIDNLNLELRQKCIKSVTSLTEVIDIIEEMN